MSTITYTNDTWHESFTLPLIERRWPREEGCRDIVLERSVAIDCPLRVSISIRTDGSIRMTDVVWSNSVNTYWHLYHAPSRFVDGHRIYERITDAQAFTLALIFSNRVTPDLVSDPDLPIGLLRGLGATPQDSLLAEFGGVVGILRAHGVPIPALA